MSRKIHQETKISVEWAELYVRALDYKDINGNYKTDHVSIYKGAISNCERGDIVEFTKYKDPTKKIYFYIDKVEDIEDEDDYSLLTGYWVWSVYAGTVKSIGDLPADAHEGEYYLIKPSKTTTIKDYVYYERVGDEWKPMGSYWG